MGHAVDAEPQLSANLVPGVGQLDRAGDVDFAVVVGSLRVGTGGAGREVPPEGAELVDGPCNAGGVVGRGRWELRGCREAVAIGVTDYGHRLQLFLGEPA